MKDDVPLHTEVTGAPERAPARRSRRDSMFLMSTIFSMEGENMGKLRIRNLSSHGLMGDTERSFEPGLPIQVELRGIGRVEGRVAWVEGKRIGAEFTHTIDPHLTRKPVSSGGADAQIPTYLRVLDYPRP